MSIKNQTAARANCGPASSEQGQTLAEVMVAMAVLGIMVVSLYAGISSGFAVARVARENLRATQILAERMEVIRLIKYDDVNLGFVPATFTAPFYVNADTNAASAGLMYTGTVTIGDAPLSDGATYSNDLRMIQINLNWVSGHVTRMRQMTTFASRYGLQGYVF
jgi:prepilin-type N-terminal cleavage/methylation domain-containing protein